MAGFIFYWAVVAAALCSLLTNVKLFNPLYIGLLIVLPLLLIFFKIQKYMVSGLTAGGVKE